VDLAREKPEAAAAGCGARGIAADVADRASIEAAFAISGPPDIVVANAGVVNFGGLMETTEEQWDRTLAVNLSGAFHTVQAAAALMIPRRTGSIVITASTNSYDGESGQAAYNATKAGLLGLLHTAANELGPYQIRVNAVCPGLIRTRLTDEIFSQPQVVKAYLKQIPLGRAGEAEDVAAAIAFLASPLASFITGAGLLIDGGQMAAKFATWDESAAEFTEGRWRLR
jgi:NAD(P)-dependent dehydrogenase (short-subunit alcohol dehydrogenase family)